MREFGAGRPARAMPGSAWARGLRAGLAVGAFVLASSAVADCTPVARLVSLQGTIEVRRAPSEEWTPAKSDALLCPGDSLRVGERSRAALRLANESNLRLDQNTTLTLDASGTGGGTAFIDLLHGAINVITRTPRPFSVHTPFVNAGVEGTEFLVRVDADAARVLVFEGRVSASGPNGAVSLTAGELAVADRSGLRRELIVRPVDAVQWALYYPVLIGAGDEASFREVDALARHGQIGDAFGRLEAVPEARRDGRYWVFRASLLLQVGRVEQARAAIARGLALDPSASDAHALLAIVAVSQNETVAAVRLAQEAVQLDAKSAVARIALSYARQASLDLPAALAAAEEAAALDPQSALAWARAAELRLANGRFDAGLVAARRALELEPELSRTHTVLGFAELTRSDPKAAQQAFVRAIDLDEADYLPRLGLGLARIRLGALTAGREAIETAAVLDPINSLVRSYLGKAYFQEDRDALAAAQFDLAKGLDKSDPTPYLYDGLMKGTQNRPIDAVADLVESIRLNDRRAVYRSQLLLDDDLAARSTSLARLFMELDLPEVALAHAATSLEADPRSPAAHRFLSEAASDEARHEITRASELLQAQLRQPLSVTPLQAQLSNDRLFSLRTEGPTAVGFNEFGSLFVADGSSLQVHGVAGDQKSRGEQFIYSFLHDNIGIGLGGLHFQTAGVRPNSDSKESEGTALIQVAATPNTSFQLDFARNNARNGDIASRFFPDAFSAAERNATTLTETRLGMRHVLSASSDILAVVTQHDVRATSDFSGGFVIQTHDSSTRGEVQHAFRGGDYSVVSGFSALSGRSFDDVAGAESESSPRHFNAYAYSNIALRRDTLYLDVGLSYDNLHSVDAGNEARFNPKIGLVWHPSTETTIRAAAFQVMKRRISSDAGLEPTHVAGLDQFFDDVNGTRSRGIALAADTRLFDDLQAGVALSGRSLREPLTNFDGSIEFDPGQERLVQAYLHGTVGGGLVWTLRVRHSRFERPPGTGGAEDFALADTTEVPFTLKFFGPGGFWSSIVVAEVHQRGSFANADFELADGRSRFTDTDLVLGYRLPHLRGNANLECTNLFNKAFRFQDVGPGPARYVPQRSCLLRLSLGF